MTASLRLADKIIDSNRAEFFGKLIVEGSIELTKRELEVLYLLLILTVRVISGMRLE